jgi:hypothetical protein
MPPAVKRKALLIALINIARSFLRDPSSLPVKIWITEGEMPYPAMARCRHRACLAPPLDIPVLAEVWKR